MGALLRGGNFAVRRSALGVIGGFDNSIDFYAEDTNLGRRLMNIGRVRLSRRCYVYSSARRFKTMGLLATSGVYARNFWSEILVHRPRDDDHEDIRG